MLSDMGYPAAILADAERFQVACRNAASSSRWYIASPPVYLSQHHDCGYQRQTEGTHQLRFRCRLRGDEGPGVDICRRQRVDGHRRIEHRKEFLDLSGRIDRGCVGDDEEVLISPGGITG